MTNDERKQIVKQLLAKGKTLSEIQNYLHTEKKDSVTYMELRLLLSEMPDVALPEKESPKPPPTLPPAEPTAASKKAEEKPSPNTNQKLSISVEQVPAPGSMLSGYARFSSGAKAHWFLDQMGRLGLEPELGSEKPTQQDMQESTAELRRMLQSGGM